MSLRVLAFAVMLSVSGAGASACNRVQDAAALQGALLGEVNDYRAAHGLTPLRPSPALDAAAWNVVCDNAQRGRLDHVTSDRLTVGGRVRSQGYDFALVNENLAMRSRSVPQTAAGWMNSAGHRANILHPETRDFGAAVTVDRRGALYWAMVSARPR